jgi:hypothetical protein
MKITRVNFKGRQSIMGVGNGNSNLILGIPCDVAWGGGKITSLEYSATLGALVIGKGSRFERTNTAERTNLQSFDFALVPWANVDCACGVADDQVEVAPVSPVDPPPAKPIQQQGQSRRQ